MSANENLESDLHVTFPIGFSVASYEKCHRYLYITYLFTCHSQYSGNLRGLQMNGFQSLAIHYVTRISAKFLSLHMQQIFKKVTHLSVRSIDASYELSCKTIRKR